MNRTALEVVEFIKENDIKFIRLSFCDPFGFHKNLSIMADELPSAFQSGILFDAYAIKGFLGVERSDLFLFPDPATIRMLPWRPGPGRVARFYCDIKNPDGTDFAHDGRYLLKKVIKHCEQMGYSCKIGTECEFYLFKTDENGNPADQTLDNGSYLDISPLDKGENIRREICLTLEEMGIMPETSHHEQGPGQNEIDFKFGNALEAADNLLTFKSTVKSVCMRNGLFASFMPKPLPDAPGSGLHVNISLSRNGENVFSSGGQLTKTAESFMAGILSKTLEMTLFLNPIVNSYERFGAYQAPKYISWSHQNRSQLIRIPAAEEKFRIELRSPDPAVNPYLAFALIIAAGLEGIEKNMVLPPKIDADLYRAGEELKKSLTALPLSLDEAIKHARGSSFVKSVIGEALLSKYICIKEEEAAAYAAAGDKAKFNKEWFFSVL